MPHTGVFMTSNAISTWQTSTPLDRAPLSIGSRRVQELARAVTDGDMDATRERALEELQRERRAAVKNYLLHKNGKAHRRHGRPNPDECSKCARMIERMRAAVAAESMLGGDGDEPH